MRFPPAHPFNPLMALRLIIAAGADRHDAFGMVLDYLRDPARFEDPEMRRVGHLPVGVMRRRKPDAQ
jgi:hypothetical protein